MLQLISAERHGARGGAGVRGGLQQAAADRRLGGGGGGSGGGAGGWAAALSLEVSGPGLLQLFL